MQTKLSQQFLATDVGEEAESILRSCVHCGFCNATCPTYQLSFDELEGPRGRIYLMKTLFENGEADADMQLHLDNCLSCKACETTCPSSVNYHRLLDLARPELEKIKRPLGQRLLRRSLSLTIPNARLTRSLLRVGQFFKPLMPNSLARRIPRIRAAETWSSSTGSRTVLIASGCMQKAAVPTTDAALSRLLQKIGISVVEAEGCCGAMAYHLGQKDDARTAARTNIDRWWPAIENGAEAIVMSASGCGPQLREYSLLLADDPNYSAKAKRLSELIRDPIEILAESAWVAESPVSIALHCPCSLVHGLGLHGKLLSLLEAAGFKVATMKDVGKCCGSAGSYSILKPENSQRLLRETVQELSRHNAEHIVTANIGCQLHLESGQEKEVLHWLELLARHAKPVPS